MSEFRIVLQGSDKMVGLVQITATLYSANSVEYVTNILTMIRSIMTDGDALSAALCVTEPPDGEGAQDG